MKEMEKKLKNIGVPRNITFGALFCYHKAAIVLVKFFELVASGFIINFFPFVGSKFD
jgi:hypothetical protein